MSAELFGTMLFGSALNAGTNALNRYLSGQQTDYDRAENYRLGEMAAIAADKRTRTLYSDFYSPQALLRQYKEAGLSPSLMFGGTPGQGGTTGAQGNGGNGIQTPYMPISLLEGAQIANLAAQTQKTKEEAESIKTKREAEIAKLWSEAGYNEAAKALAQAQKTGQEWNNYITSESADFDINRARELAEIAANDALKGTYEIIKVANEAKISEGTWQAEIEKAIKEVKLLDTETLLKKAEKNLTEAKVKEINAEITKWQEEVKQGWKNVYTNMKNATTNRRRNFIYEEYVMRSMSALEKEVFNKYDIQNRQLQWTIVDGTFDNMLDACNSMNPTSFK